MTEKQFLTPLPILDEHNVYRQVHIQDLHPKERDHPERYPKPSHFKPDPDGLSVYWNQHIDPEGVYNIIGLSYKANKTEFKDPANFFVFSIPVLYLRAVEGISDVSHSPRYIGNPAPIGSPNIYSHASIVYSDDEEIRLKLSDYCKSNHASCHCKIDFSIVEKKVQELRQRLDNTIYHRLPED
ncbi:hypothetical protein FAM09_24635 [Niastella caeni]|uniref:Uncharacterized protein n=1 Tax=Niastella caeni TaxID=2569763 RepID=A0A4S8HIW6_9BACT|nr:hypothetical protein [Niastella caeni]THU34209.1 hypothetical protein FAM09_24635 [Niastella caeni]